MNKNKLDERLVEKAHDDLRKLLSTLITEYCTPSFGSMTKHDIDLLLFKSLISLGFFSANPSVYDVMRELKVTRNKARNLIYEYQLRLADDEQQLMDNLKEILRAPLLSKQSDNVCLEIENPCMIDFIRNELKKAGHITDGSFNPEMVKMSCEAFSDLYFNCMKDEVAKVKNKLVELGVAEDTSIKALLPHLVKGVAKTVAKGAFGKIGENLTDKCFDYLSDIIKEKGNNLKDTFKLES